MRTAAPLKPLTSEQREMADKNFPLVLWVVDKIKRRIIPQEEMVQEGSIGLIEAVVGYDPKVGAFSTYARPVIERRIMDAEKQDGLIRVPIYLKSARGKGHRYQAYAGTVANLVSINVMKDKDPLHPFSVYDNDDEFTLDVLYDALRGLSPLERSAVEGAFIKGETVKNVARNNGTTRYYVRLAMERAKTKLRYRLRQYV